MCFAHLCATLPRVAPGPSVFTDIRNVLGVWDSLTPGMGQAIGPSAQSSRATGTITVKTSNKSETGPHLANAWLHLTSYITDMVRVPTRQTNTSELEWHDMNGDQWCNEWSEWQEHVNDRCHTSLWKVGWKRRRTKRQPWTQWTGSFKKKKTEHQPSWKMITYLLSPHCYSGDKTCCITLTVTHTEDRIIAVLEANRNQAQNEQHIYLHFIQLL